MNIQITPFEWLKLPIETRAKLAEIFQVPKSRGVILEDNTVKSDGYTYEDLANITAEKMREYLLVITSPSGGDDSIQINKAISIANEKGNNFVKLFDAVIEKIEQDKELELKEDIIDPQQLILEEWVATLNRLKGQAVEKEMMQHLVQTIKRVFEIKTEPYEIPRLPTKRGRPKKTK